MMVRSRPCILVIFEGIDEFAVDSVSLFPPVVLPPESLLDLLFDGIINIPSELLSSCNFFIRWQIFSSNFIAPAVLGPISFCYLFILIGNITGIDSNLAIDAILFILILPIIPDIITFKLLHLGVSGALDLLL